jgi:hypothetical protein
MSRQSDPLGAVRDHDARLVGRSSPTLRDALSVGIAHLKQSCGIASRNLKRPLRYESRPAERAGKSSPG